MAWVSRRYKRMLRCKKEFVCAVTEYDGEIIQDNGITSFFSKEAGIIVPLNFPIDPTSIGKKVSAMIRDFDGELLLKQGANDICWSDIDKKHDYPICSEKDIEALNAEFDDTKQKIISELITKAGIFVGAIAGALIMYFAYHRPWIAIGYGMIALGLLLYLILNMRLISTTRIYDCEGNWVDVSDGTTSLNGNSFIWLKADADYNDDGVIDEKDTKLMNIRG